MHLTRLHVGAATIGVLGPRYRFTNNRGAPNLRSVDMKKHLRVLFVGAFLVFWNTLAFAADRAVNITVGSIGSGDVSTTIATVRQLIGYAVGAGVVDDFMLKGGSVPVEGGLTACVEAGVNVSDDSSPEDPLPEDPQFSAALDKFGQFVKQLRSIQPDTGIFLNLELAGNCIDGETSETSETSVCPAGESCLSSGFCSGNESSSGVMCSQ